MRRRTFLTLGLTGAAAFTALGWWTILRAPTRGRGALDSGAATIIAAIVPAMLDGALPTSARDRDRAIEATIEGVERAIAGLPPAARAELGQLFTLLDLAPARRAFAGVSSPWAQADQAEVGAFLERWRTSGWALKRSAYDALHQLILAAWYGNPRAWSAIGYPGPPRLQ